MAENMCMPVDMVTVVVVVCVVAIKPAPFEIK